MAMACTMDELHAFERHNTLIDILKTWCRTNDVADVISVITDYTNAFIVDAAYGARISNDEAAMNLIKNFNETVSFKVVGIDHNSDWVQSNLVVNGITYFIEWSTEDDE